MPADFYIDAERGVVFSKAVGVFDLKDAIDHMERLKAHPHFRPNFRQIADFLEVTTLDLTHDQVRNLAMRDIYSGCPKRAFVVPNDLMYGVGRVFSTYRDLAGESGIRIFRDMSQALEWLELDVSADPALFPMFELTGK